VAAAHSDIAHHHADAAARAQAQALYEFLVPVVKGWSTEMAVDVASAGVQVHGGMGFIEETGAAQHYRDARILPIYEGTTAIQANDLLGRKTARDGGATARRILEQVRATCAELRAAGGSDLTAIATRLEAATDAMGAAVDYLVGACSADPRGAFAGSVPYLKLAGIVLGGWQMARAAAIAQPRTAGAEAAFYRAKVATARFFAEQVLSTAPALQAAICSAGAGLLALDAAEF